MAANRYGKIWHGDFQRINLRFESSQAREEFRTEFETYHDDHEHDGDRPIFMDITSKEANRGYDAGSRTHGTVHPVKLVSLSEGKFIEGIDEQVEYVTIDGYTFNEIKAYHNPTGVLRNSWYTPPTTCVAPIIVIGNAFVDSGTLKRHELSAVFGDMPETDFQSLLKSVQADGFIDPIIRIHEGHILDGWHRYRAAQELNLIRRLRFQEWDEDEGKDGDPKAFVLARNIERRHLNPSQRAQIVVTFNERFNRGNIDAQRHDSDSPNGEPKTRQELAQEAGVGTRTIDRAVAVEKAGQSAAVISGDKTPGQIEREAKLEQLYQNRQNFQTAVSDFAQSGSYLDFTYCRRRIKSLVGLEDSTDEGSTDDTQWNLQKIKAQSQIAEESVRVIKGYLNEDPKIETHPVAELLSEMQRISDIHQSAKLDTDTPPFRHQPLSSENRADESESLSSNNGVAHRQRNEAQPRFSADAVERIENLWTSDWEAKSDEERLEDLNKLEVELPGLIAAESEAAAPAPDDLKTSWKKVSAEIPKWKQRYKESGKQGSELVSRASKSQLIHALREYRETEQVGAATMEELEDVLQLLKNNSYPLAYRLRQIVRPEQKVPQEEVAEKGTSVCEGPQTEGNGLARRQRNEQDPRFSESNSRKSPDTGMPKIVGQDVWGASEKIVADAQKTDAETSEALPLQDALDEMKQESELHRAQENAATRRRRMWSYFAEEHGKTFSEGSSDGRASAGFQEDFAKAAADFLGLSTIRVSKENSVGLGVEYCFGADEFILGDIEAPSYSIFDCTLADATMWASRFDVIATALMNMADWVKVWLAEFSETTQHKQTRVAVEKLKTGLKKAHVIDSEAFADDILQFYTGVDLSELSTSSQETLENISDFIEGFVDEPLQTWPEYIRNHRWMPKRELVLVSIGISNNTDDEFELVEFIDEGNTDEIRCDLNALPEDLRAALLKIAAEKIYAEAVKEFHTDG